METFDGDKAPELLAEGLYELLHTKDLEYRLTAVPELQASIESLGQDDSPEALARYVADAMQQLLQVTGQLFRVPNRRGLRRGWFVVDARRS